MQMTDQEDNDVKIETDFYERTASSNQSSGLSKVLKRGLLTLVIGGIIFGIVQAVMFFANFKTNQYLRNVSIVFQKPSMTGTQALVNVEIANYNAVDVKNPTFDYVLTGVDGSEFGKGELQIQGVIPAGDMRVFEQVALAKVVGKPSRMKADLKNVEVIENKNLPAGMQAQFAQALEGEGDAQIQNLEALKKEIQAQNKDEKVGTALILLAQARAYEKAGSWAQALPYYKQSVELDPSNANAHFHLGMALAHEKQMDEAVVELKKANEMNPQDHFAAKGLVDLTTPAKVDKNAEEIQ